jgi:hypothetical protein
MAKQKKQMPSKKEENLVVKTDDGKEKEVEIRC